MHLPYRNQLFVATLVHGLLLVGLVVFVNPNFVMNIGWRQSYLPFLYIVFAFLFFLLWSITSRWKRSLLWSLILLSLLWLRINQLDEIVNIILLIVFGCVWEYYWKLSKNS